MGVWTFRDSLLPSSINETIDEGVTTIDNLEHELGIDSFIHDVAAEMDTLASDVVSELDSLVTETTTEVDSLSVQEQGQ